jgi:hypothetical protein
MKNCVCIYFGKVANIFNTFSRKGVAKTLGHNIELMQPLVKEYNCLRNASGLALADSIGVARLVLGLKVVSLTCLLSRVMMPTSASMELLFYIRCSRM